MSARAHDTLDIAWSVAQAIDAVGGDYFVGGSVASSLQGDPRTTNDIDIVLSLPPARAQQLAHTLGPDFEVDVAMLRDALVHARTANAFYLPLLTKVDFFGVGSSPFDESEFARKRPVMLAPDKTLFIKSPEDSIVRKLLWYREGGEVSERQWRDVIGIVRLVGAELDHDYIELWTARVQCADLWQRLLASVASPR